MLIRTEMAALGTGGLRDKRRTPVNNIKLTKANPAVSEKRAVMLNPMHDVTAQNYGSQANIIM